MVNMDLSIIRINTKLFHPYRFLIMRAILHKPQRWTWLWKELELDAGNLASHLRALEREGFIRNSKHFEGRKPVTIISATVDGKAAFIDVLEILDSW